MSFREERPAPAVFANSVKHANPTHRLADNRVFIQMHAQQMATLKKG